jgi:hypothetical protein
MFAVEATDAPQEDGSPGSPWARYGIGALF